VGQVGVLLYLLREPVPLWRGELRRSGPPPVRGGVGFAQALLLGIASSALATGVAYLLR
jgi:hypothetical protein